MIRPILRTEVLKNDDLAYSIGTLQEEYQAELLIEAEDDQEVERRSEFIEETCDSMEYDPYVQKKYCGEWIATYEQNEPQKFLRGLVASLTHYLNANKIQCLYFLLEIKLPWLESNDHQPLLGTWQKKLFDLTRNESYDEAFAVESDQLPQFIEVIFWINLYASELPLIWFCDDKQTFVANICAMSNLHFHYYDDHIYKKSKLDLVNAGFRLIKDEEEVQRFL